MGRPSAKRCSAQRLGKRERARRKKRRRFIISMGGAHVPGGGLLTLKAGRKKWQEATRATASPWNWDAFWRRCPITRGTNPESRSGGALDGQATGAPPPHASGRNDPKAG